MIWYFVDEKSLMETLGMEKKEGEDGAAGDAKSWVTSWFSQFYLIIEFKF